MIQLTVQDLINHCQGTLFCGDLNLVLDFFSKDTRTIKPGDIYFGIKGERFDGNVFYEKALEKGASCCILDSFDEKTFHREIYGDRTIVIVPDTLKAIQNLAAYKRSLVDIPVIAVTGSVGKTSTKDMIACVLKEKYRVLKSEGNLNGQLGLPLNILKLKDEEVMVLEMGMNDFGQISVLTNIAKPTMGVITNIGTAHIGILGSRENILKSKLELLEGMKPNTPLIVNNDTDLLQQLDLKNNHLIRCAIHAKADYQAKNVYITENLSTFEVINEGSIEPIEIPVMGEAFVQNSLLSIAIARELGLSFEEIRAGLKSFVLEGNRMEVISILEPDIVLINDSYNSNYEAIISALDTLIRYPGKRHIAVLGDVLEMEDYAKEIHTKIGQIPAILELDYLFLQGESAAFIKEGAIQNGYSRDKIFYFEHREELTKTLLGLLESEDTVLIKASNGMHFGKIVDELKKSYDI